MVGEHRDHGDIRCVGNHFGIQGGLNVLDDLQGSIEVLLVNDQGQVAVVIQVEALGQEFDVDALSGHGFQKGRHHARVLGNRQDFYQGAAVALHDPSDL